MIPVLALSPHWLGEPQLHMPGYSQHRLSSYNCVGARCWTQLLSALTSRTQSTLPGPRQLNLCSLIADPHPPTRPSASGRAPHPPRTQLLGTIIPSKCFTRRRKACSAIIAGFTMSDISSSGEPWLEGCHMRPKVAADRTHMAIRAGAPAALWTVVVGPGM